MVTANAALDDQTREAVEAIATRREAYGRDEYRRMVVEALSSSYGEVSYSDWGPGPNACCMLLPVGHLFLLFEDGTMIGRAL
jgi:hypothetical protein